MNPSRSIVVVGGGIGGLTAALALAARGHHVTVCEAAVQPRPLGVGINLLPHAVRVFAGLGLLPALEAMAVHTRALVFANRHGQTIYEDLRGLAAGSSHPQLSIHRGHLQMRLWDEAVQRLGPAQVRTGERVVAARETANGAVAEILHADGTRSERACDILVGADGITRRCASSFTPTRGPRAGTA